MYNFKKLIEYTEDRIYCAGEFDRNVDKEINGCIKKFEKILQNSNYNVCNEIDENGNNILHLIAENGFYEFYIVLKNNENFDKLKNMTNNDNMTNINVI